MATPDEELSLSRPSTGSFYERVGGDRWFVALIEHFYSLVDQDPVLRPLYPDDLSEPRKHLTDFLIQRFGGPDTFARTRGHPRLGMRHSPFKIGADERDAWMNNMTEAVRASGLAEGDLASMLEYFDGAATMLINR